MIPESVLQNVQHWLVQGFVIASIGVALPLIFRIRHPRSQLAFCHLVILACLFLPAVQPWQHPVVQVNNVHNAAVPSVLAASNQIVSSGREVPWRQMAVWTIMLGALIRLIWTAAGL